MLRSTIAMLGALGAVLLLMGCGEGAAPASASAAPASDRRMAEDVLEMIGSVSFETSPPGHPSLAWPELAPRIRAARSELRLIGPLPEPKAIGDALDERIGSDHLRSVAAARARALILRAEAGRLLAMGRPDDAARELAHMLRLARTVSTWGAPGTAEAAADIINRVLEAMDQPANAPMTLALTSRGKSALLEAFGDLDDNDPAGRMRAMVESFARREEALRERAAGEDGPVVVRRVASRYASGASLGTPESIERAVREANAFSRALADGWDRSTRSAITTRLRQRQAEDATGVLIVLLGEAPDACDADARLRERIEAAGESLR